MKGAQSAAANGHPRIPAAANQNMPWEVLRPPFQFMKAAAPSVTKYMAKLDGRKAEEKADSTVERGARDHKEDRLCEGAYKG
ncbi:hypothetical protein HG530_009982 [Fusarium avenaceum]|nr:hypothetical protein HG530_009982 [Fusarium avenaceum]